MQKNLPYLVQRLQRKTTEGKLKDKMFSDVFQLDYMGSAEFEFGAFPRFLRDMYKAREANTLIGGATLIAERKVFFVYDTAFHTEEDAVNAMKMVHDNRVHLKEAANFPPGQHSWMSDTHAWADIRHNLFWSYENLNTSVMYLIENSVIYMDERAKERNKA